MKNTTTKDDVIRALQSYVQTTGIQPTYTMTAADLGISPTVVRRLFGTWNNAIVASGLTISRIVGTTDVTCDWCGAQFARVHSQVNQLHNYCSRSCAAKANNTGSRHSEETKKILAAVLAGVRRPKQPKRMYNLTCEECGIEFTSTNKKRKMCSSACKGIYIGKKTSIWLTTHRSHIKGSHVPSYMESSFKQWLVANGINEGMSGFLAEVHFINKVTRKNGWADFVFPHKRCIIELDGSQHQKRTLVDNIRDEYLRNRGWTVVRITHKEYRNKSRLQEIKQLLSIT